MAGRFEKHARTVSLLTLVSRVTGLARDAALSRVFGAGPLMSAFFFAFLIPNLFRRLFGEGALASAFLPSFARLEGSDPAKARAFASATISLLLVVLGGVTILIEAVLAVLLARAEDGGVAIGLTMIMLPYMPLVCAVAILGAMLQVRGRFGPAAASPVVLNVFLVAATLGLAPLFAGEAEAGGRVVHASLVASTLVLAGLVQLAWAARALGAFRATAGGWWVPARTQVAAAAEVRAMVRLAGPMILSLGVLQLNTFFDGVIASYPVTFGTDEIFGLAYPLDAGAMAVLSFAQRLYQFPLGVFGIAVATAIFPLLAKQADEPGAFGATLRRGLRLVVFIGLPASVGLVLVREPLTAVIYQGGAFTPEASERVGFVLLGYAPAIWAYSMTHVLTRAFYARGDSVRPTRVAMSVVVLNVALNLTLIWTPLKEAGLAWSTSICSFVQAGTLLVMLRRHVDRPLDAGTLGGWGKTVVVTLAMAGAVLASRSLVVTESVEWWAMMLRLAVWTGAGALAVLVASYLLRMPELRWALGSERG